VVSQNAPRDAVAEGMAHTRRHGSSFRVQATAPVRQFLWMASVLWLLSSSVALSCAQSPARSGTAAVVARWSFHRLQDGSILEEVGGKPAQVRGAVYAAVSPVGAALQFDGYTSEIIGTPLSALDHPESLSVACWVRVDAYPWNRVPILDQLDSHGRFFFGVDAQGRLTAFVDHESEMTISTEAVPLRRWFLVILNVGAGVPSFMIDGVTLHSEARPQSPTVTAANAEDLIIGHVRSALLPEPEQFIHPQFPIEYSLEGALGELTIYNHPLSSADAHQMFARSNPKLLAPLPWPQFPRWQGAEGKFGAYYASLPYDHVWDQSRRVAPDSDVVVRFGDAPIQLIFWQGNNYVPAWVTENNRWYTDEFMETYGHSHCPYGEDCEPMSDKQVRYSHVQILENTPARVVIHWRYALSEVEQYAIADAPSPIGWGDWADEYWTVYPDGVAIRRSVLWSTAPEREKTEFQESIVLIPPGQTPEDNIHLNALTFANLQGQTQSYSWQQKSGTGLSKPNGPARFNQPDHAVIQWVNLKSEWKPFEVAWGDPVSFTAYNSEMSISSFEWWNHWPVAQIPSSGRPALAADRPGHTSVSHIYWPLYREDSRTVTKILMTGLTRSSAADLAPLAASWREPSELELADGRRVPFDPAQRAYVLPQGLASPIRMTLRASREHPVVHTALVVPGWNEPADVKILKGAHGSITSRTGEVDDLDGSRLIVFLPVIASDDIEIELHKK